MRYPRKMGLWVSLGAMVVSILAVYFLFLHFLGDWYYGLVAGWVTSMLQFFGVPAEHGGGLIVALMGGRWTALRINWECSGVVSLTVYAGLVMAFPRVPIRARAVGLVVGYPAIFFGNVTRIFSIIYLSHLNPGLSYIFTHDFFGRPLAFMWMVLIWFFWFYYALIKVHPAEKKLPPGD